MNFKSIIKAALLIFIIATFVALFVKDPQSDASAGCASATSLGPEAKPGGIGPAAAASPKVVAYYFHTTFRCASCKKIEAYSREAIESGFSKELKDGTLEWRVINVEERGNRHYIDDYRLFSKSLILVKMKDGKQAEWKNLIKVWQLLGNREPFLRYVQDEVRSYLEAS
jgi:hypothetical protein